MVKAVDKTMVIGDIRVMRKSGGRSGTYTRQEERLEGGKAGRREGKAEGQKGGKARALKAERPHAERPQADNGRG
jgi:hypothetical protein